MPYCGNFIKRVEILFIVISRRNHVDFSVLGFIRKGDGYLQEIVWHERVRNNTLRCGFLRSHGGTEESRNHGGDTETRKEARKRHGSTENLRNHGRVKH